MLVSKYSLWICQVWSLSAKGLVPSLECPWWEHIKASLDSVGMWEHRDKQLVPSREGKSNGQWLLGCLLLTQISLSWMSRQQGWMLEAKMNFTNSCTIVPTIMARPFWWLPHDPEEVKDYADRNIHLVRNQDSPWRCFNVHESDQEVEHA